MIFIEFTLFKFMEFEIAWKAILNLRYLNKRSFSNLYLVVLDFLFTFAFIMSNIKPD